MYCPSGHMISNYVQPGQDVISTSFSQRHLNILSRHYFLNVISTSFLVQQFRRNFTLSIRRSGQGRFHSRCHLEIGSMSFRCHLDIIQMYNCLALHTWPKFSLYSHTGLFGSLYNTHLMILKWTWLKSSPLCLFSISLRKPYHSSLKICGQKPEMAEKSHKSYCFVNSHNIHDALQLCL